MSGKEHRTTMTISALIVGIAAFHYYYMRGVYVEHQVVSIEYRYMDWMEITVPLMALKFPNLVGKDAITDKTFAGLGFTGICFTGALVMIGFGYAGEAGLMNPWAGLFLGGMGWAMIIVATGTHGQMDSVSITVRFLMNSSGVQTLSDGSLLLDGSSTHSVTSSAQVSIIDAGTEGELWMGIAYNIADMINKIGFGVVAWMGAKAAEAIAE